MSYLYPKCPKCGRAAASAESDDFDRNGRIAGHMLRHAAHAHPYLKAAHLAATLGWQVYKRVPGGGEKQCTACGHRFR
jgi:hypothetical protein